MKVIDHEGSHDTKVAGGALSRWVIDLRFETLVALCSMILPFRPDESHRRRVTVWLAVFCAQLAGAIGWWWIMPHGFPWLHPRCWANLLLPWLLVGVSLAGCYAIKARRPRWIGATAIALPVGWTAALLAAVIIFPVSAWGFGLPLAGCVALLWLIYLRLAMASRPSGRVAMGAVALAILVGATAPWTQRAPAPSTLPCETPFPNVGLESVGDGQAPLCRVSERVQVLTATGDVMARFGALTIEIAPLLSFESRSPDRCWTLFAPRADRVEPRRRVVGQAVANGEVSFRYAGGGESLLRVRSVGDARLGGAACAIEAFTRLEAPVYSHLNTFATILIRGHRQLSLSFSPCSKSRVAPEPADYPVGRPARFAFLDAASQFHVVQATSGEKGPFKELGHGPLDRTDQLTIALYDNDQPVAEILFDDWASQASVDLSPTAGWGVAMNSIEFLRHGDSSNAAVEIWLSLAATSVGRGWDSVGHTAGTYRNRIHIQDSK